MFSLYIWTFNFILLFVMLYTYDKTLINFRAQLNFSGPEFSFAKFWEVLKKSSGS